MTASVLFLVFVALRFSGEGSPLGSLILASGLTAAGAALFAFLWPAGSWRWGLWLGSAFALYLGVAFVSLAVNGDVVWWPLIEASTICAAGCVAAEAAGSLARQRRV